MARECLPCQCAYDMIQLMAARDHVEEVLIADITGHNYWLDRARDEDKERLKERRWVPEKAVSELRDAVSVATTGACRMSDIAPATPMRGREVLRIVADIDNDIKTRNYDRALGTLDMLNDIIWDNAALICK